MLHSGNLLILALIEADADTVKNDLSFVKIMLYATSSFNAQY